MSLNPYCNGWSSKSSIKDSYGREQPACLNPYCNGWSSKSPADPQDNDFSMS